MGSLWILRVDNNHLIFLSKSQFLVDNLNASYKTCNTPKYPWPLTSLLCLSCLCTNERAALYYLTTSVNTKTFFWSLHFTFCLLLTVHFRRWTRYFYLKGYCLSVPFLSDCSFTEQSCSHHNSFAFHRYSIFFPLKRRKDA